jgi:S1-C subfamily serine protease
MRFPFVVASTLLATASLTAATPTPAQNARIYSAPTPRASRIGGEETPRAALGISTSGSTRARDTLGLLVSSVMPNGPAERAGIEEGDRIASINGVTLRLSPEDVGDFGTSSSMSRRLTRELGRVRPGDEVDLRVYAGGRTRTVQVRTLDSDSLYGLQRTAKSSNDDRPTLGLGIAATNSRRDSLGVLVMYVDDDGPAARAGIEEGNRIAAIENVDLRVGRDDSGDDMMGSSKVRRLQREVARLRPGDDVELRVYSDGRFHSVRLRVARAADLPHHHGVMITGDGMNMFGPGMPLGVDGALIGPEVRRSIERAMEGARGALEGIGRGWGGSRAWQDDNDDERPRSRRAEPTERIKIEPLEPSKMRMRTPVMAMPRYSSTLLLDSADGRPALRALARSNEVNSRSSSINVAGLRLVSVGSELASYLGRGSERGLFVAEVPSWARQVLQAGDVILAVDGEPVRPDDRSNEVSLELPRFRDAQLDILRDGVHHSVTLPARR